MRRSRELCHPAVHPTSTPASRDRRGQDQAEHPKTDLGRYDLPTRPCRHVQCATSLGNQYGWVDADGKSATELEFDHATKTHRERLVFVKGAGDKAREADHSDRPVHLFRRRTAASTARYLAVPGVENVEPMTLWRGWGSL
jgi:hypothetical protein